MKKGSKILALLLASLFLISFALTIVSAKTPAEYVSDFISGTQNVLKPIFTTLLGNTTIAGELTGKVLIFILIIAVVCAVLSFIPLFRDKPGIGFLVSVIISILGVRYLPEGMISSLATPSSAMAAAITILLPFIIFGWFVVQTITSSILRRFAWIVFAGVFVVLWARNPNTPWNWMYVVILLGCLLSIILDGTIMRFFKKAAISMRLNDVESSEVEMLMGDIRRLESALDTASNDASARKIQDEIRKKERRINQINAKASNR